MIVQRQPPPRAPAGVVYTVNGVVEHSRPLQGNRMRLARTCVAYGCLRALLTTRENRAGPKRRVAPALRRYLGQIPIVNNGLLRVDRIVLPYLDSCTRSSVIDVRNVHLHL